MASPFSIGDEVVFYHDSFGVEGGSIKAFIGNCEALIEINYFLLYTVPFDFLTKNTGVENE